MSNRNKIYTDAVMTIMRELVAQKFTVREIAKTLDFSGQSIAAKLQSMGLKAARNPAEKSTLRDLTVPKFPQFEDVDAPDRDRRIGPKPRRQYTHSLTGNSSELCAA